MKKFWFRRRKYGWGWYPASVEGWIVTVVFIFLVLLIAKTGDSSSLEFYVQLGALIIALLIICYRTGETPSWSWGR